MDSQYTPIHTHLWNREFWMLNFAGLLLTASAFLPLPLWPVLVPETASGIVGSWGYVLFALGLPSLGAFLSFFIARYRRNVICLRALTAFVVVQLLMIWTGDLPIRLQIPAVLVLRFLAGAFYGLAQMVLLSTLVTDCCESEQRTEANYAVAWFERLALPMGPVAGLLCATMLNVRQAMLVACGAAFVSLLLVQLVKFPFRAPEDTSFHLSTDRFLFKEGMPLLAHILAAGFVMAIFLSRVTMVGYTMLAVGFMAALVIGMYAGKEGVRPLSFSAGMYLLLVALLLSLLKSTVLAPMVGGLAEGVIMANLQLSLVHVTPHCQRGTSQSSLWLAWEVGIAIGLALFYGAMFGIWFSQLGFAWGLVLTIVSLECYKRYTSKWYTPHVRR